MRRDDRVALLALLSLITLLHGCDSLDGLCVLLTEQLGSVIPADLVTLNTIDLHGLMGGSIGLFYPPVMPTSMIVPHFDRYLHQHPLIKEFQWTGDGSPRRLSDDVSQVDFRRTELYRFVFEPLRSRYLIAFSVSSIPGLVIGIHPIPVEPGAGGPLRPITTH